MSDDANNENSAHGITRDTKLGDIKGVYRTVMTAAFKAYRKGLKKARKSEEDIDGDTDHLTEREEIASEFEKVIGARMESSMRDTPIGRAIREGESRVLGVHADGQLDFVDGLEPGEGIDLQDDATMIRVLDTAGYRANPDAILIAVRSWDMPTRREVFRWATAMFLVGRPDVYVKVPKRPDVVQLDWLDSVMRELIASGDVDPETLKEPGAMSEAEISKWISHGPWAPYQVAQNFDAAIGDGDQSWSLRFNAPEDFEGERPTYAFVHSDEKSARLIAATINKRLVTDTAVESTVNVGPIANADVPMTELEIIGWTARGPWGVIAIDAEGDEIEPDDVGKKIVGYTLEWMWAQDGDIVPPTYNLEHDVESEAMGIAAERNRRAAEHAEGIEDDEDAKPEWLDDQSIAEDADDTNAQSSAPSDPPAPNVKEPEPPKPEGDDKPKGKGKGGGGKKRGPKKKK